MDNPRTRLVTDAALLVLAVLLVIAIALPALSPVRPWLALGACAFLPGAAVLTLLPVKDFFTWCLISILVSLAVATIMSLAILWLGLWHPLTLAGLLGAASVLLLSKDLYKVVRSPAAA